MPPLWFGCTFPQRESKTIIYRSPAGEQPRDFTEQQTFGPALAAALAARRHRPHTAAPAARTPRPPRRLELLQPTIDAVIPDGRELARAHWYRHVCAMIRGAHLNANRKRSLRAVARAIHLTHTRGTGTFMAGVQAVVALAGYAKATVNRALAILRSWQVLVTVAEGRSKEYTPGRRQNDRAVWALLVPVDKTATPLEETPEQAPQTPAPHWQQFARKACGSAPYRPMPAADRDVALWHGHATTSSLEDEALASHEIQRRLFLVLGKTPTAHLTRIFAPLLREGITVKQILHRIDHRPDGSMWPHDGGTGIRDAAAWARHRLAAWAGH